jgi:DNA-directed RNA polymerase subunit RPC12/RpoP
MQPGRATGTEMNTSKRSFSCQKCSKSFEEYVHEHEAPACHKCGDSEWVIRRTAAENVYRQWQEDQKKLKAEVKLEPKKKEDEGWGHGYD